MAQYSNATETDPLANIVKHLPASFENCVVAQGFDKGVWRMILRVNISSREEVYQWKAELEKNTHTDYNYRWVKQMPDRYVWNGRFLCSRTDQGKQVKSAEVIRLQRPDLYKATGCKHAFNVRIDYPDGRHYANDPQRAHFVEQKYLTEIHINEQHNHDTTDWISSNHLRAEDDARMKIASLLKGGLTPQQAIAAMAEGKTQDEIANNRELPKPHVYYEIARVLKTQEQLKQNESSAKTSSPAKAKATTTPSRVLKRSYAPTDVAELLTDEQPIEGGAKSAKLDQPPVTRSKSESSKPETAGKCIDAIDDIVDTSSAQTVDEGEEETNHLVEHMMVIPPAPGRPPVPEVSTEMACMYINQTNDHLRRLYSKHAQCPMVRASAEEMWRRISQVKTRQQFTQFMRNAGQEITTRRWNTQMRPWDVRDRLRYLHESFTDPVATQTILADGVQYVEAVYEPTAAHSSSSPSTGMPLAQEMEYVLSEEVTTTITNQEGDASAMIHVD